jgi:predicted GTPase
MTTALLVISLFNLSVETGQNIQTVVHTVKAVHHHFTRPIYRHTVKPVVREAKKIHDR